MLFIFDTKLIKILNLFVSNSKPNDSIMVIFKNK